MVSAYNGMVPLSLSRGVNKGELPSEVARGTMQAKVRSSSNK